MKRFRGAVVTSFVSKGWPWDSLRVAPDRLELTSLADRTTVGRDEIEAVELHRQRFPFLIRTFVVVRYPDGTTHERIFVPARTRSVRRTLVALGWPVVDRAVTTRQTWSSPHPDEH